VSSELFEAIFIVLAFISVGIIAKKTKILSEDADACILKLVINVLMPCFIFSKIVGNDKVKDPSNVLLAPLAGFAGVAIPVLLCLFLSRYIFKIKVFEDIKARRTFAVSTGLQNYGFIAIPVIERVFGEEYLGIMLLHNMGVELALWSVGLMVLSGEVSLGSLKKVINGPFVAVVISLSLNALGLDAYVPKAAELAVDQIGAAFIPIGVMLVGTTTYTLIHNSDFFKRTFKEGKALVILGNTLRSGLIPLLIIGMAMLLPYSNELQKVIVIEAAMPAAFFPIVMARHYNGRADIALQISMTSLVVGFLALPLWVAIGQSLLNL
jgi:malate permease and related proteins